MNLKLKLLLMMMNRSIFLKKKKKNFGVGNGRLLETDERSAEYPSRIFCHQQLCHDLKSLMNLTMNLKMNPKMKLLLMMMNCFICKRERSAPGDGRTVSRISTKFCLWVDDLKSFMNLKMKLKMNLKMKLLLMMAN